MTNQINTLDELKKMLEEYVYRGQGSIVIYVNGIPQISKSNDIVGSSLQEWLPAWFLENGLTLTANEHTQEFPDFIAHFNDYDVAMDIKCWNYDNSPAFDIANFDSFYRTMYDKPDKIMAKYLVIGYKPNNYGFTIEYVSLKNVWDLVGKAQKWPLGLQVKQKRPYAIRPINFKNNPDKAFGNVDNLLKAVVDARKIFPLSEVSYTPEEWYSKVKNNLKSNGIL